MTKGMANSSAIRSIRAASLANVVCPEPETTAAEEEILVDQ